MILSDNQGIKVLRAGASWHGGEHEWSLPTRDASGAWTPGEWTPRVAPSVCSRGWHLTTQPGLWWSSDAGVTAYLAEWDGALARHEGDEKFAVERCRLLRELTADELAACGVFLSGSHEVWAGSAWAYGSATVRAYDSTTVTAYDSATVWAYGSAKAHAAGQSVATTWGGTVVVTRADRGVIVDRRSGTPRTVCKRRGLDGWRYDDGAWSQRVAKVESDREMAEIRARVDGGAS